MWPFLMGAKKSPQRLFFIEKGDGGMYEVKIGTENSGMTRTCGTVEELREILDQVVVDKLLTLKVKKVCEMRACGLATD